ncbi:unnamed protein product [Trifolium pratense]|uniref:Uncharacterized protein n=1 Tax=Trifolium pratense TaxID=57577 RepID=A0ACB0KJ11_TRIPR|nr:unnamed protein product [Trifolium pratense]
MIGFFLTWKTNYDIISSNLLIYIGFSSSNCVHTKSYNDEYVFLLQDVKIHDEGVVELEVDEKCLFMEFSRKLRYTNISNCNDAD